MDDFPLPSPSVPVPRPKSGWGCFVKGCLALAVLAVLGVTSLIGLGWYVLKNATAYFGTQPAAVRVFPTADEQYNATLTKLAPFAQALREGRAATVALSADDLNILVARAPQCAPLRGHAYFAVEGDQLISDLSAPLGGDARPGALYFNGRAACDASYSSGDFTFILRRVEPLSGPAPTGMVGDLARNPGFLQGMSDGLTRGFNRGFHERTDTDPRASALLRRLRTVILKDGQIIVTSAEGQPLAPEAVAPGPKAE